RLPQEHTIYLGDTARVPYGTRSGEGVTRYALMSARHLARHRIKLLVVACNTVSAHSVPALADAPPTPGLAAIYAGPRMATARTRGGAMAVLGAPATVASGAYQKALQRLAPLAQVIARPCPLFVPLAEEGWTDGEVPRLVAERYLGDLRRAGVDTAVLGCTHYPLLSRTIADVLGPRVAIVDSAQATAAAVDSLMTARGMLRRERDAARHRTLCTDVPDRFRAVAERFLGRPLQHVELIDLQP